MTNTLHIQAILQTINHNHAMAPEALAITGAIERLAQGHLGHAAHRMRLSRDDTIYMAAIAIQCLQAIQNTQSDRPTGPNEYMGAILDVVTELRGNPPTEEAEDQRDAVVDLITDALLHARAIGIDTDVILRAVESHMRAEINCGSDEPGLERLVPTAIYPTTTRTSHDHPVGDRPREVP